MIRYRFPLPVSVGVAVLFALATGCSDASPDRTVDADRSTGSSRSIGPSPSAAEPTSKRLSARDLQQRWWTWAAASPERTNPVADETGEHCTQHQPDGVWLVAGTFGGKVRRTCTVPAGLPLAGPALNFVTDSASDCSDSLEGAQGEAILDGVAVPLDQIDPVRFIFNALPDNPVTSEGGPFDVYGCGLWMQITPPTAGKHTLVLRGSNGDFSTEASYELTVLATTSPTTPRPTV